MRLIGVGVGPGDPDQVTVQAVRVLTEADVVVVPVGDTGEVGRAERIVLAHVTREHDAARLLDRVAQLYREVSPVMTTALVRNE